MTRETIKNLEHAKFSTTNKKLCNLLFKNRDILHSVDSINIYYNRVNLISKIYTKINCEHIVFLCSFAYSDRIRLCEIAMGALSSMKIKCFCEFQYDTEFVDFMRTFIQSNMHISVYMENNILSLRNNSKFLLLADLGETDLASQQSLCRSLCILLAMCGKVVSNNLDEVVLNDYGICNSFIRDTNEHSNET